MELQRSPDGGFGTGDRFWSRDGQRQFGERLVRVVGQRDENALLVFHPDGVNQRRIAFDQADDASVSHRGEKQVADGGARRPASGRH